MVNRAPIKSRFVLHEYEFPKFDGHPGNPDFRVNLPEEVVGAKVKFAEETFKSRVRVRGVRGAGRHAVCFLQRN